MKGRRRRGERRRTTFAEVLRASRDQANRNLMRRARRASRLAKRASGRVRWRLYDIKNRCLACVLTSGGVTPHPDHVVHPGLLLVRVPGEGGLHTHEAWLAERAEDRACLMRRAG